MQSFARTPLVTVDDAIRSSYHPGGETGGGRAGLLGLSSLGPAGRMTPDTGAALLDLHEAMKPAAGDLRITDARRPVGQQARARKRYEWWLAHGRPDRDDPEWDPAEMQVAFTARPGRSFHQAGRAIDIDVDALSFDNGSITGADALQVFWRLARSVGWRPIAARPDPALPESWHFDHLGPWAPVYDRIGYEQTAICACLDVGVWVYDRSAVRFVQAQLHRAGYDCGDIDGHHGPMTTAALDAAGVDAKIKLVPQVAMLPSHDLRWVAP